MAVDLRELGELRRDAASHRVRVLGMGDCNDFADACNVRRLGRNGSRVRCKNCNMNFGAGDLARAMDALGSRGVQLAALMFGNDQDFAHENLCDEVSLCLNEAFAAERREQFADVFDHDALAALRGRIELHGFQTLDR